MFIQEKEIMIFSYTRSCLAAVTIMLLSVACKKETETAPYPYNAIISFTVPLGDGDSLHAAVSDGELVLYWPATRAVPAAITPVISVSEKAGIQPASGQSVTLADSVTYTVTSESGVKATYRLKLRINQAAISLNDEVDVTAAMGGSLLLTNKVFNVIMDTTQTHIFLVSGAGTVTPVVISKLAYEGTYTPAFVATVPSAGLDTGSYKVKINSGVETVTSSRAFVRVNFGIPSLVTPTEGLTVKSGDTFTFTGANLRNIASARARFSTNTFYDLEVVSFTATSVTLRMPATNPAGTYNRVQVIYNNDSGGISPITLNFTLTVAG